MQDTSGRQIDGNLADLLIPFLTNLGCSNLSIEKVKEALKVKLYRLIGGGFNLSTANRPKISKFDFRLSLKLTLNLV